MLRNLHHNYIANTSLKAIVYLAEVHLCSLTKLITKIINTSSDANKVKIYVNTKILKHLYDKKPAEEYDFILNHAIEIVKYPDKIFQNNSSKKGDYLFLKTLRNEQWLCSIEKSEEKYYMVTCFRVRKESYLDQYTLIWSWKGDKPSS